MAEALVRNAVGARRGWGAIGLAAPSWVLPGALSDNCRFLAGKVDEAALLFFESAASLAYTRHDLPPEMAGYGLRYHVHLPLDLSWESGGASVAAVCLALMEKVAFLDARRAVLHPPPKSEGAGRALDAFAAAWAGAGRAVSDVLLENTKDNDLCGLWPCIAGNGYGLCLDLGHMLAYGQSDLRQVILAGELPRAVRLGMVHCNAPGSGLEGDAPKGAHLPLVSLDADGAALGEALCALLDANGVAVAEFFDWEHVARSLPIMDRWLRRR